ncbi:GDP/UDP-N,N'-diacetylbacillosamine 2-epimerase (hydrolysing) [Clostridium tetanomorphum]|uniref:UDP-N-acetylglucosamine 2-epimerase (Hydrolyzing) n=1 Tax=Clostridium tetanomorphum TaxID=1553 RepID=A0A923EF16_CLOTT|nr:UDP-N-acetylglucosamine 2-epimerase [Clostridium tetanomorphum]KAJ52332.1 UDP-N-acetylglucosamine 2-epimerase [Clostridium tetanomorphum DSM 665]MBC2400053.1 UDP-N-acetylglucosamine 2-epimerase (hydrolyzing) [Clostridium tetanomorphum]MBP1865253.1 GDP/UDP-N,N'-diacetylbacillosamine 2-epimerase (hydrolyzing) [Clostridium tetanomorphum]NRS85176.1 GDP/UDP-N,N'-diacetylbacillosamine 2-epimerase (hydrolysing) [Clostridium tetanomorphum]NRZ98354.1 GDP/UDP-N,N'-diacetylbacillosamine 2-epimerase (h
MKKILVVTGTRADYGLLYWTMREIQNDVELELQLVVTGNHLVKDYGYTVEQIKRDGFQIDEEIDIIINSEKKSSIVKSMGLEMVQMAQCFDRLKPDILLILGDRYETFVAATCAMMMNISIAHMNGGESTEGAVDEQIRHSITKMAHIHFTGAEYYKERIVKMGEEPWRVYNVGQAGIENIKRLKLLEKYELQRELNVSFDKPVFLVTYHPVTLDIENIESQMNNLLDSLKEFDAKYIFTYPNADFGSKVIIDKINDFVKHNNNAYIYYSLGQKRYLSLLKSAHVMIGNSSSGIIEAPTFKIPVINIGDRQKGRLRSNNIIDVGYEKEEIIKAINRVLYDKEFKENLNYIENLYGDGNVSKRIVSALKSINIDKILLSKKLTY